MDTSCCTVVTWTLQPRGEKAHVFGIFLNLSGRNQNQTKAYDPTEDSQIWELAQGPGLGRANHHRLMGAGVRSSVRAEPPPPCPACIAAVLWSHLEHFYFLRTVWSPSCGLRGAKGWN